MKNDMESAPSLEDGKTSIPPLDMGKRAETLAFDTSDYLPDLEDLDINEAAKIELLIVLHDILSHFVQMGFDLKDADVCGQLFGDFTDAASGGLDGVESGVFTAPEMPDNQTEEDSA